MKNWANQTAATTAAMPMSGCFINIATTTRNSAAQIKLPGKRGRSFCSENNHAATTAKVGLTNSEGCSDKPGKLIQRRAPLISDADDESHREQDERDAKANHRNAADGPRRLQRDREHEAERQRQHRQMAADKMQPIITDPLGHRRACRQAHDDAEADQRCRARQGSSGRRSTTNAQPGSDRSGRISFVALAAGFERIRSEDIA